VSANFPMTYSGYNFFVSFKSMDEVLEVFLSYPIKLWHRYEFEDPA